MCLLYNILLTQTFFSSNHFMLSVLDGSLLIFIKQLPMIEKLNHSKLVNIYRLSEVYNIWFITILIQLLNFINLYCNCVTLLLNETLKLLTLKVNLIYFLFTDTYNKMTFLKGTSEHYT